VIAWPCLDGGFAIVALWTKGRLAVRLASELPLAAIPPSLLTKILQDWSAGDATALDRLTPLVYAELHRIAEANMLDERHGHVLQPSALVNEAFIRLMAGQALEWTSRAHFFAHAACLMRRILIDFARLRQQQKRGGGVEWVDISSIQDVPRTSLNVVDFLDLDCALEELADLNQRHARVVELRYFGGLEIGEVALVLGVSDTTVVREWRFARAWLFHRLQPQPAAGRDT
jgi:RNA polymerase sigma factor (TIGR02999 family)